MGLYGRQREQIRTDRDRPAAQHSNWRIQLYRRLTLTNRYWPRARARIRACGRPVTDLSLEARFDRTIEAAMPETPQSRAARLAHLRRQELAKGDPVPLPLTMASIYHLPGDPTGFNQYGR